MDWRREIVSNIIPLNSASAPELADYVNMTDVALRRKVEIDNGLYLAESAKVIERALAAGHQPRSVLVQEQWVDQAQKLLTNFPECPLYLVSQQIAEAVSGFDIHRGAIASMHRPALPSVHHLLSASRRVVILEDIVDHTNVGAIFRAAAGFGVDAVFVTARCADPLYRRSVRVSMGTVFQVPWTRLPEWDEAVPLFTAAGFHTAALALSKDAVSLREFAQQPREKIALVLGSEGDGLSRLVLSVADTVVTIPMKNGVDSLNVASACAVALYAIQ